MQYPIEKADRISILLAALQERYAAQRTIRERVQSIGVWVIGLFLAAGGWIIQDETELSSVQKLTYVLGILTAFVAIRYKYLSDLQQGFKIQQQVTVKLERALGFFTPELLDNETEPIYPKSWENAGTDDGRGGFFRTTFLLVYIGVIFLISAILLSDNSQKLRYEHFPRGHWEIYQVQVPFR